jgi:glycosyltransferase involved in cell wall biosynthesis
VPRLASLGHEVIISAFWGLNGASTEWNGHLVLPGGQDPYGSDILASHARYVRADLVITLMDVWPLDANQVRSIRMDHGIPVAHWMPVDCDRPHDIDAAPGLSVMDERHLKTTGATPIAMSRFGQRKLAEAGLDALYVPHGILAREVFTPDRREEARKALGLGDRFVVGVNAANKDAVRKNFPGQLLAFARFRKRHPEALLMLHSLVMAPGALDLQGLATRLGIMDAVRFADQYAYLTGMLKPEAMAGWMSAADVGLHASYGEGFGLAGLEFQACGTPVITTDATAMTELAGPGWLVRGQEFWNSAHANWWTAPLTSHTCPQCGYEEGVDAALEAAWQARENGTMPQLRGQSRQFALQYDAGQVLHDYWKPALAAIMERAHPAAESEIRPSPERLHDRMRDTVLGRLEQAHAGGVLDAGEFGRRSHRATVAETGAELAALLADLPAAKEAA